MELGEGGVFQSPEAEKTLLQCTVIHAIDVVLAIRDGYQIWILLVNIDAGDLTTLRQLVALELEKWCDRDLPLLPIILHL